MNAHRLMASFFVIAMMLPAVMGCQQKTARPVYRGGPHYFSSVEAKRHMPYLPSRPISEAEALSTGRASAYYKAFFDDQGHLIKLQAVSRGEEMWRQEVKSVSGGKSRRVIYSWPSGDSKEFDFTPISAL